jgi:hypothetical protein
MIRLLLVGLAILLSSTARSAEFVYSEAVTVLLQELSVEAGEPFAAEAGRRRWFQDHEGRSCTTCHSESLDGPGWHEKTGKLIEPMAPSVNPERLTNRRKIDKWFLRNCKWTLGRECTAQEKGDFLIWLVGQ